MNNRLYEDIPAPSPDFIASLERKLLQPQFHWIYVLKGVAFLFVTASILIGVVALISPHKENFSVAQALERIESTYQKYEDPSQLLHTIKRQVMFDNSGNQTDIIIYDSWAISCGISAYVSTYTSNHIKTIQYGNNRQNISYDFNENTVHNEIYAPNQIISPQLSDCNPRNTLGINAQKTPWTIYTSIKQVTKNGKEAVELVTEEKVNNDQDISMSKYYFLKDNYVPYLTESYLNGNMYSALYFDTLDLFEPTDNNLNTYLNISNFLKQIPNKVAIYEKYQTGSSDDQWVEKKEIKIIPVTYHIEILPTPLATETTIWYDNPENPVMTPSPEPITPNVTVQVTPSEN